MTRPGENHLTEDNPTGDISGIDADALMEQVERGGNHDIPMTQSQPAREEPAAPAAPATAQEYEFDYKGQKIKISPTDPRFSTWLSGGYGFSQNQAAFKQERETWDAERKKYDPYKAVDDYAKQNPDWWKHVEQSYQARTPNQGQHGAAPASPELQAMQEKLQGLEQFKTSFETQQQQAREQQEDSALDKEVQSIREQFKDLDWATKDKSGMTLEERVLKHAIDMGLDGSKSGVFRAAFRDYNHDHLLKLSEERGRESHTKEIQKRTRLGIIGTSPNPKKGHEALENPKSKSWRDVGEEALEMARELQSGKTG